MNEQEQRWIQAARGGDEAAFGELVRLYQKRVYALAVRLCPTPELAEEAAPGSVSCSVAGPSVFPGRRRVFDVAVPADQPTHAWICAKGAAATGPVP